MEDARDPKPADNVSSNEGTGSAGGHARDKEATSSETLSDLEKSEKASGTEAGGGSDTGSSLEGSSPRPTGEGGGRADGSDSGGPM